MLTLFLTLIVVETATCSPNYQQQYTPDPKLHYSPFYKGSVCTPSSEIKHPTTDLEVLKIVQKAIRKGDKVKAFGARHSITDILCTPGVPIDMTGISGMELNTADQSVEVAAGVNLFELSEFLKSKGRALKIMPGFGNITVGGAIGTGAHGSSLKHHSTISEQVIGLKIIDGRGHIRRISKEKDLRGFRLHLGLLGIILRLTLRTEPLYKVKCKNSLVNDSIFVNGSFLEAVKSSDQVFFKWFPSTGKSIMANCTMVDASTPGEAWANDHQPPTYFETNKASLTLAEQLQSMDPYYPAEIAKSFAQFENSTMHMMLTDVPGFAPVYTYDGLRVSNPAVGYNHRMYAPICHSSGDLQCPWLHGPFNVTQLDDEMAVDLTSLPALVEDVKKILKIYPAVFPLQGIFLRFSLKTQTYMSTSYKRDVCHFEFHHLNRANAYENATAGLAAYQTILQTILYKYNGKPHWGKSGAVYHSEDILESRLNPKAKKAFVDLMDEFDPNGVFVNDFGRRLVGTGSKANVDNEVTHCALLDNCFCSSDHHCADYQVCRPLPGYCYPACVNKVFYNKAY